MKIRITGKIKIMGRTERILRVLGASVLLVVSSVLVVGMLYGAPIWPWAFTIGSFTVLAGVTLRPVFYTGIRRR